MIDIAKHCFVSAPFFKLRSNLDYYLDNRIQPEIGLEGEILYDITLDDFAFVAKKLKDAGLQCTLHAPFYELFPGSLDRYIAEVSRNKLRKAFELIEIFEPQSIVCHLSFEENKHSYREDVWFKNSLLAWQELLAIACANKTPMMLENTYELEPSRHKRMLQALDSPYAKFCFDVGHVLSFAGNTWQDWLPELLPWLGQLHLHDNNGDRDQHLAIGEGSFPFAMFFDYIKILEQDLIYTIEPHHEGGMAKSFKALANARIWFSLYFSLFLSSIKYSNNLKL